MTSEESPTRPHNTEIPRHKKRSSDRGVGGASWAIQLAKADSKRDGSARSASCWSCRQQGWANIQNKYRISVSPNFFEVFISHCGWKLANLSEGSCWARKHDLSNSLLTMDIAVCRRSPVVLNGQDRWIWISNEFQSEIRITYYRKKFLRIATSFLPPKTILNGSTSGIGFKLLCVSQPTPRIWETPRVVQHQKCER